MAGREDDLFGEVAVNHKGSRNLSSVCDLCFSVSSQLEKLFLRKKHWKLVGMRFG